MQQPLKNIVLFLGVWFSIFSTGLPVFAASDIWQSPDGRISVMMPASDLFQKMDTVTTFNIAWGTPDGSLSIGVTSEPNPKLLPVDKPAREKVFVTATGATITYSEIDQTQSVPVLKMMSKGRMGSTVVYSYQAIVAVGDKVYKAIAMSFDKDIKDIAPAMDFVDSLKVSAK